MVSPPPLSTLGSAHRMEMGSYLCPECPLLGGRPSSEPAQASVRWGGDLWSPGASALLPIFLCASKVSPAKSLALQGGPLPPETSDSSSPPPRKLFLRGAPVRGRHLQ